MSTVRDWAWRFALFGSVMVGSLSFLGGVSFFMTVIRGILAFGLIYGLSELGCILFEKTGTQGEDPVGALIDIAVGDELASSADGPDSGEGSSRNSRDGALGRQAGMAQSGLGQAPLAGQVNQGLPQGLPDEEKQAEIIRRMGWGE